MIHYYAESGCGKQGQAAENPPYPRILSEKLTEIRNEVPKFLVGIGNCLIVVESFFLQLAGVYIKNLERHLIAYECVAFKHVFHAGKHVRTREKRLHGDDVGFLHTAVVQVGNAVADFTCHFHFVDDGVLWGDKVSGLRFVFHHSHTDHRLVAHRHCGGVD